MSKRKLPSRWSFKHSAYYYRPHPAEKHLFDGKSWFRLGVTYPAALRKFAAVKELEAGQSLLSCIDRVQVEVLPRYSQSAQAAYAASMERLRKALGHNPVVLIKPKTVYQYIDAVAKSRTMNVANADLKVLNLVLDCAVRWGVIDRNQVKGAVKYFGVRDGLKKTRDRYVEDWELAAWQSVASPQQRAFAALVMLTGARKADTLRILEAHVTAETLVIHDSKTGRPVPPYEMTDALRDAVEMCRACKPRPSLYLLPNADGRCYVGEKGRCESFDRAWRQSMEKAVRDTDLEEPFTRHDLRAKVGSDADTDRRAQELLGHTSPSMTRKHYRRKKQAIRPVK